MLPGLNHNIRYKDLVLHVQTEDSGPPRRTLTTHIFFSGTVVAHELSSYAEASEVDGEKLTDTIRKRMQEQHRRTLKQLTAGQYDVVLRERGILGGAPHTNPTVDPPAPNTGPGPATGPTTAPSMSSLVNTGPTVPPERPQPTVPTPVGPGAAPPAAITDPGRLAPSLPPPQPANAWDADTVPRSATTQRPAEPSMPVSSTRLGPPAETVPNESLSADLTLPPGFTDDLPRSTGSLRPRRPATRPASRTGASMPASGPPRPAESPPAVASSDALPARADDALSRSDARPAKTDDALSSSDALPASSDAPRARSDASLARVDAPPARADAPPARPPRAPSIPGAETLIDLPPVLPWTLARPEREPILEPPSALEAEATIIDLHAPIEDVDLENLPPLPPYPSLSAPPLASAWGESDVEPAFPAAASTIADNLPLRSWRPPSTGPLGPDTGSGRPKLPPMGPPPGQIGGRPSILQSTSPPPVPLTERVPESRRTDRLEPRERPPEPSSRGGRSSLSSSGAAPRGEASSAPSVSPRESNTPRGPVGSPGSRAAPAPSTTAHARPLPPRPGVAGSRAPVSPPPSRTPSSPGGLARPDGPAAGRRSGPSTGPIGGPAIGPLPGTRRNPPPTSRPGVAAGSSSGIERRPMDATEPNEVARPSAAARSPSAVRRVEERSLDEIILGYLVPPKR